VSDSLWWRDIRNVCGKGERDNWFNENITWIIGSRDKIRFWDDKPLKEKFSKIHSNSNQKNILVGEMGAWNMEVWEWKFF